MNACSKGSPRASIHYSCVVANAITRMIKHNMCIEASIQHHNFVQDSSYMIKTGVQAVEYGTLGVCAMCVCSGWKSEQSL